MMSDSPGCRGVAGVCRIVFGTVILPAWLMCASPGTSDALDLELYAVAHMSADTVDDGNSRDEFIASNSSRLGLSGSHEVAPGLSVVFQFEQGVDLTGQGGNDGNGPGSTNGLFTNARDSYLGIAGGFGTIRAGKLAGLNQWVYDYNLFADQVGDLGNVWGGTGLPGRISSALQYQSPSLSGLTFDLTYAPEEGVDEADILLAKANYVWNELKLGVAYIDVGGGSGPGTGDQSAWALTGSYDFGSLGIGGGWQRDDSIGGQAGNDRDSYSLGATLALGAQWQLKAQVAVSDANLDDADATLWAFGVDYAWTPELTVYVAVASVSNDANAAFSANDYGKGDAVFPAPGDDPGAVSLGIVYRFSRSIP